jgi:hypothetical protein
MEKKNSQEKNNEQNKINNNDKRPILDEKKKIIGNIVKKSIECSKATIGLTSIILDSLMTKNKEKIISLCENGLPDDLPELRSLIWKINFGYLPLNMEEWDKTLKSKRLAYQKYKDYIVAQLEKELELFKDYNKMTREEKKNLEKKTNKPLLEEICKDTNRTHTEMSFFFRPVDINTTFTKEQILALVEDKRNCTLKDINATYKINIVLTHSDIVSRILFIYSKFEPIISYVQGMNEILAIIYYCFSFNQMDVGQSMDDIEADAFWSFYNLMSTLKILFDKNEDKNDIGINGKVKRLKNMLKSVDKQLYDHLINSGFDFSILAFRWISLMFSQDFLMMDLLRIWDYLLCHDDKFRNCYYFCLSIILMKKEKLMKNKINEIYETFQNIKDLEVENIIANAKYIEKKCGKKCLEIMKNGDYESKNIKKK